jgi:hypothetical protein
MASEPVAAEITFPAGQIDLADHPFAGKIGSCRFDNFPDELMAGNPAEAVISPEKLEIGIADSPAQKPDQGMSCGRPRAG